VKYLKYRAIYKQKFTIKNLLINVINHNWMHNFSGVLWQKMSV